MPYKKRRKKKTAARCIKGYRMLEPDALKGARPVLRREGRSNPPDLFDVSRKTIGFSKVAIMVSKSNEALLYPF